MNQPLSRNTSTIVPFVEAPGRAGVLTALTLAVAASVVAIIAIEALGL